jgi:hypothetical protein
MDRNVAALGELTDVLDDEEQAALEAALRTLLLQLEWGSEG